MAARLFGLWVLFVKSTRLRWQQRRGLDGGLQYLLSLVVGSCCCFLILYNFTGTYFGRRGRLPCGDVGVSGGATESL